VLFFVQRNEDLSVKRSDRRTVTECQIERLRGSADIIQDQVNLIRGNYAADFLFYPAKYDLGIFQPGTGFSTNMQPELSGVHFRKKVPADKWKQ
jgi:hypothetical protein